MTIKSKELNKAVEEARALGFTKQLILVNGSVKKLITPGTFLKKDFAIVKTCPVNSINGYTGTLSYVVLNDCTLGYFVKESKKIKRKIIVVEEYAQFE